MHRRHLRHRGQAGHDAVCAPPLDPDQHQAADRRILRIGAGDGGEAQDLLPLQQPGQAQADGRAADAQPVRQVQHRGAPIAAQLRDQRLIQIVHNGTVPRQYGQ